MRKKSGFQNSKQIYAFLKARYGIPQSVLDQFRLAMAEDVMCDGEGMAYNRIYTLLGIAVRKILNVSVDDLYAIYNEMEKISSDINNNLVTWEYVMKQFAEDTGIIIRSDRDGVVGEYFEKDEVDAN